MTQSEQPDHDRVALVLQGGGALGAYQAGVFQALDEFDSMPDWVAGTSIGAINAAIIAGNPRAVRLDRLRSFWKRVSHLMPYHGLPFPAPAHDATMRRAGSLLSSMRAMTFGQAGFFRPRLDRLAGMDQPSLYDTSPLRETLSELIDFALLNGNPIRFTAGAVSVTRGEMVYFDSREREIRLEHVLASGALPPGFPPVEADGELFWDGGITSNTPIEVILDPAPRESTLCFMVNLWRRAGTPPQSIADAVAREKEIRYASRFRHEIESFRHRHDLRRAVRELYNALPEAERRRPEFRRLGELGCHTRMDIVRLADAGNSGEPASKDADFEYYSLQERWERGYRDARDVLQRAPWRDRADANAGVVLHDLPAAGTPSKAAEGAETDTGSPSRAAG